jgi:hypothetical protein
LPCAASAPCRIHVNAPAPCRNGSSSTRHMMYSVCSFDSSGLGAQQQQQQYAVQASVNAVQASFVPTPHPIWQSLHTYPLCPLITGGVYCGCVRACKGKA